MKYLTVVCAAILHVTSAQSSKCHKRCDAPSFNDVIGRVNDSCKTLEERNYRLPRIETGKVGSVEMVDLVPGRKHARITRAQRPALFEVPEFLTPEECEYLICRAKEQGSEEGMLIGKKGNFKNKNQGLTTRQSNNTFLEHYTDPVIRSIQERLSKLTGLPIDILEESEKVHVVHYGVGGHYHSHYDSGETTQAHLDQLRCCQHHTGISGMDICSICRYISTIMYLNDVEEGGETAFPLADTRWRGYHDFHINLSENCYKMPVIVKPKRGTLVMWYNMDRHPQTGWLGPYDPYGLHGGCPVIKGEKWISSIFISASQYHMRHHPSIFTQRWQ